MSVVGKVREIWRFPVKSMQGDTVPAAAVSSAGLLGDRAWAMRDEVRQEVQWGKLYPQLMLCRARYVNEPDDAGPGPVAVTFPDGETVTSEDPRMHDKLSTLIGRAARLWPLQPAADKAFYRRYKPDEAQFAQEAADWFAREPGEPLPDFSQFPEVLMDYVAVPGTFFDNEEIHVITTASIAHMRSLNAAADWDIRRFRPNFYIETVAGLSGLAENAWVGKRLRIGEIELDVTAPTPRCGMTVRPQGELTYDKSILRSIVKEAEQCLGVGAHCRTPGTVRAGDTVELVS